MCKCCVFPPVPEALGDSGRLCSRWTESDRGKRERWSEILVKAAGQWGRQKLIRATASFTTPQLDQFCVQAANQLAVTECERCGLFFFLSLRFCGRVYLPAQCITHSLLSPPSFGLTQTNCRLITISRKLLPLYKCQLDDNLQATLEWSGCSENRMES